ncbi:MAG: HD domain-containing protein [Desulfobacterales bacterium]|nr:HD domain-containing protein [Desulfobacterales bacterium]
MNTTEHALKYMNTAVFSVSEDGNFQLAGPAFRWIELFFSRSRQGEDRFVAKDSSPFFYDFLSEATAFWGDAEEGSLDSGPWIETDDKGGELPFEATAIREDGERLLILRQLGESYRQQLRLLQVGREQLLTNERLEAEVSKRTELIRTREEEVARRLLAASGFRDLETGAHVRRIGLYSEAMGEALGWSRLRIDDIRSAAPMHDVGKIGIPDRILLKPGRLDDAEFEIMKSHTQLGAKILEGTDIEMIEMARNIAWYHHEHWDGAGYPSGLEGEAIPVEARIVSIVDVYDAMVHRRVYKEPIAEHETLHYIRSASGRHFDPDLVEVFLSVIDRVREIKANVSEDDSGF